MCLKNIISSDEEYAHQRADNHKRLMREQRDGWDGKNPPKAWVGTVRTASAWTYSTSHSEQFNED